jgi:hypothetical protein
LPSGLKATQKINAPSSLNDLLSFPLATLANLTVESKLDEARVEPSGANATHVTTMSRVPNVVGFFHVDTSHKRITPSSPALAVF